ncbi:MAG TPA: exosortase K [Pyrinomonadaceae bacterium]|nr:exosortase K [Pyrinomonadaceae bacterium]
MNRRRMMWGAQLAIVALCALALKQYYSTATANELRWILAPTILLVELLSGRSFKFESYTGYMSSDHSFNIAVPCAGVNFLITAFVMLALRQLWRARFESVSWRFLPISMGVGYVATLIANTVRICVALEIQRRSIEVSWLTANQLHRLEGIVVYFGFLMLLFMVMERGGSAKSWVFPLAIYYAVTLGVPFVNGGFYRAGFWEHFAFVVATPLVVMLPMLLSRKKAQKAQNGICSKRTRSIRALSSLFFCAFLCLFAAN